MTGSNVEPDDVDIITPSRKLFKEAIPYLLKDTEQWFFSRSLVFNGYNGVIDKEVQFLSHDPVGGLLDLPIDPSAGIRCAEKLRNREILLCIKSIRFRLRSRCTMFLCLTQTLLINLRV
ncbi:uncharacterized protein [Spinacia oleracea]|uniref:Uncharacterized protein n=1 Tax=Spinacia oleracea TaxID=3562 RepID=A0ABM3QP19_SPIOL|nr:uncharacterized protein LOC110794241 [Spinacia oleracea]XP_056685103.1 uncharacterized protein LOC110794241 [Spinacia oleracea]